MCNSALPFELRRVPQIQAIVLDIEGTTTPIGFVYDVLFRFARTHLCEYLDHADAEHLHEPIRRLRAEWSGRRRAGNWPATSGLPGPSEAQEGASLCGMADGSRSQVAGAETAAGSDLATGLSQPDCCTVRSFPTSLRRFSDGGTPGSPVAIHSSGSQPRQRLLFGRTRQGDLTALISRFFDTEVGAKRLAAESYDLDRPRARMSRRSTCYSSRMCRDELNAAREAGCQTLLCVRPGNRPQPEDALRYDSEFRRDRLGCRKAS